MAYLDTIIRKGTEYEIRDTDAQNKITQLTDDMIAVSDTQPSGDSNKVWIKETADEVDVPTMAEHNALAADVAQNTEDIEELKLKAINEYVTPQMFGAKGDGSTDDYQAVHDAIVNGYLSGKSVFVPSGVYRLSRALDLSSVPFTLIHEDYRYTIKIIGQNMRSTILKFDSGVTNGLYCDGKSNNNYRRLIIDNLQIISVDYPNGSYNNFDAVHIKNCPDSIISNMWITGGNHGLYIDNNCWDTSIEYITARYCNYGIMFDGYNESIDAVGYCDNISGKYLYFGNSKTIGLYIRGVVNGLFENLDYEISNGTACDGIVIESSNNININMYYAEWIKSEAAIKIKSIHDNNIQMIPKNITIQHAKFYRCDGHNIRIEKGIYVRIDSCEQVTNYNEENTYGIGNFLSIYNAQNASTKYIHHIYLTNNVILNWPAQSGIGINSATIIDGIGSIINPYYPRNVFYGELSINRDTSNFPNAKFLLCTKTGTRNNDSPNTTGSGESGTKKITVADASHIYVGTYIAIGTEDQLYVIRKNGNDVYLYNTLANTHTDEQITVSQPTFYEL